MEFFRLLDGGVMGDQQGLPDSRLAILPGATHLGVIHRPEPHTIVPAGVATAHRCQCRVSPVAG